MEIIKQEELENLIAGQTMQGVVLVTSYAVKVSKSGREYIDGKLQSGTTVKFRVWTDRPAFEKMKINDLTNKPCEIKGTVDEYNGAYSIIITDIIEAPEFKIGMFMPVFYDVDRWYESLVSMAKQMLSDKGMNLLGSMLFNNPRLVDRLKEEFAAMNHHDNCRGGLLAHTVKMLDLVPGIIDTYPTLVSEKNSSGEMVESPDKRDLLVIGCIMHDIGKVREMKYGVYQRESFISHRFFGAEYVEHFRKQIIELYSEKWFYDLEAILLQHHDEFGDPCRNLYALIIHKIDDIESSLTNLSQEIETNLNSDPSGEFIWYDGKTLYI